MKLTAEQLVVAFRQMAAAADTHGRVMVNAGALLRAAELLEKAIDERREPTSILNPPRGVD